MTSSIVVCSWNVHQCVGRDGRREVARVAAVLREVSADIIALQEVHSALDGEGESHQSRFLAEALGLNATTGSTLLRSGGHYGNLLLSRWPPREIRRHDLSVPRREPRGAIEALVDTGSGPLRVVAVHLGLGRRERSAQVHRLLASVANPVPEATLVMLGDWNEWWPWGAALRRVRKRLRTTSSHLRTFPASYPVLALDRIWVSPVSHRISLSVHRTLLARQASDHLPLVARVAPQGGLGRDDAPPSVRH